MEIKTGEIITIENGKEYICFSSIKDNDSLYVYLVSNFKPLEIRFAIQRIINNSIQLELINNPEQKKKIMQLFQQKAKIN